MIRSLSNFAALGLLGALCAFVPLTQARTGRAPLNESALTHKQAADKAADKSAPKKVDFAQPQSPTLPAPKGLTFIDQGTHDPRLKGYQTPAGFKLEIVAENPAVVNPVGMLFGDDGTPYVLEWRPSPGDEWREAPETFKYKDGTTRQVATMRKKTKDVVKVLSDSTGKGMYDKAKIILEDELPSSILLHDGWIYLSSRGTVRRFKQSKPGGAYDVKEIIAQGFCGFHHHQVSGMTLGNDGWLYVTSGDDDNFVEGSDGSRATVLRTGAVFRCRPDGSKMHTFALGFRNPYRDVAFDSAYNMFHVDNDNEDGSKFMGCRLMHIAEGNDFGWRLFWGARCCRPDLIRGAVYGELPGKVPPMLKTGRGSPAGLLIYNDTRLPEAYRGLFYYPDVFRQVIRAYRVEPNGSSFQAVEEFEFLKAPSDPLFRPCQMVTGPDGAIYIVDWRTNSGGAGKLWGDGVNGRIYRLSWVGTKDEPALPLRKMDSWAGFAKMTDADLINTLSSEEFSFRERARNELVKRGEKNREALIKLLLTDEKPLVARIAALGALNSVWNPAVEKAFLQTLAEGEAELKRLAADGLGLNSERGNKEVNAALLKALTDDSKAVKRSVIMAMGRVGGTGAADSLASALSFDDGKDVVLRDGIIRALENLGRPGIDAMISLADSGVQKDTNRVVEAFLALRTKPAYDALPLILKNQHVNVSQRAALVRSASNYLLDPPVSIDPVLALYLDLKKTPRELKMACLDLLATPGTVKGSGSGNWVMGLLADEDSGVRLAAIKAIEQTRLNAASRPLIKMLAQVELPAEERVAAIKAVKTLSSKEAVAELKALVAEEKSPTPGAEAVRREAFLALAALEPGQAAAHARKFLTSKDATLQSEAVQMLGTTPEGARDTAKLFLDKKLPRSLLPQVSEGLRKHAAKDAESGKLLAEVMKSGLTVSYTKDEIARVEALVKGKGNAANGRALFLNSTTLACINCHKIEGVGGQVGPDLTRVWDTHTVEKVMESIIEPSKEIKEGFQTYQVTTKRGQVFQGLKIAQTGTEVVLRDSNGKDIRIPLDDLEEQTALKTSLMPENAIGQLSYAEFIDLIAFLKSQTSQESLRGMALDYWVIGPFGADLKKAYPPEERPDPKAVYEGKKWQQAQALPSGMLDLRALLHIENGSAYALTNVHSPKAQKAQMLLGSDDTVRVWVNGKLVHEHATTRGAKPDEDRVTVDLREGWNTVLVKVVNGNANHELYLRFSGDGLKLSRTPTEK